MSGVRGNQILFKQDSQAAVPIVLKNNQYINDCMQVFFYGKDGNIDKLFEKVNKSASVYGRLSVLRQWYYVLKELNPYYQYKNHEINSIVSLVEKCVKTQKNNPIQITDKASIRFEHSLGLDVAGTQQIYPIVATTESNCVQNDNDILLRTNFVCLSPDLS